MSVSAGSRYTAWIQAQVPFFSSSSVYTIQPTSLNNQDHMNICTASSAQQEVYALRMQFCDRN